MRDAYWVESIRTGFLTEFFLAFPFFASGFFYVSFIAIGYWLRPGGRTFLHLGFLVPFATVIAAILKNSFQILRPPVELQLVPVDSPYGFPSADVLVAVVFWGTIFQRTHNLYIRLIAIFFVGAITMSQVYLGVHTIADVVGGISFGLLILAIWHRSDVQLYVTSWFGNSTMTFWLVYGTALALYFLTYDNELFRPEVALAFGAMSGFGLSFASIRRWRDVEGIHGGAHLKAIALSYVMLIMVAQGIPPVNVSDLTMFIGGIIEYAIIIMLIYAVFPRIIVNLIRREIEHKQKDLRYDPGHDIVVNYKSLTPKP